MGGIDEFIDFINVKDVIRRGHDKVLYVKEKDIDVMIRILARLVPIGK